MTTAAAPAIEAMGHRCVPLTSEQIRAQPVCFVYEKELPCTPEQLFEVFEDPTSWPKWAPGIGKVIWTSPKPYGVGTTRTVVFWGGTEVYEEFVAWDAPREMAFTFNGTSEEIWNSFGEHYRVEETPGGCKLTWTVGYDPTGGFGRVHRFIKPIMRFNLGFYMVLLRRYVRKHVR
ncbi:MAG: SRPBCC family protein [Deltaproteobacteria bacterium]|nr:MAG: SRPBCC family protein [Deltaproteobacteria bacterium]